MDSKQTAKWQNLKQMTCPFCTGKLIEANFGYKCTMDIGYIPCTFRISYDRFNQIVKDLYQPTAQQIYQSRQVTEEENREHLNNL